MSKCETEVQNASTVCDDSVRPPLKMVPDTITAQTPYGELVRLAPPVQFSETKGYWEDPVLTVRGASKPQWKNR